MGAGAPPEWELIVCSYAESLALDFSRNVRTRMRDKEFHVLFPETKLDRDNQNAQGWKTTKKGGFLPAGVGGPITGKGAHVLIIDDPIKNTQEAESRDDSGQHYAMVRNHRLHALGTGWRSTGHSDPLAPGRSLRAAGSGHGGGQRRHLRGGAVPGRGR